MDNQMEYQIEINQAFLSRHPHQLLSRAEAVALVGEAVVNAVECENAEITNEIGELIDAWQVVPYTSSYSTENQIIIAYYYVPEAETNTSDLSDYKYWIPAGYEVLDR